MTGNERQRYALEKDSENLQQALKSILHLIKNPPALVLDFVENVAKNALAGVQSGRLECNMRGCTHDWVPAGGLIPAPCHRCNRDLPFCGWCRNCQEQWPK